MIVSAAIVSENGDMFYSNQLPAELKSDITKHASNFLYSIRFQDEDVELPYIETTNLRYIYKQTGDLYWLLVTRTESDFFTDIHILGKFVCTIMEYGASETTSTTLTQEQRELFFTHIWRPWDEGGRCPFCSCHCNSPDRWEQEFESRLQFLISIRNGDIDDNDANYVKGLVAEAWSLSIKLSPRWNNPAEPDEFISESDSVCSTESRSQSIGEESVIDGCRMKCRLEDIRIELTRIQDPYLRLFAKRDLLIGSTFDQNNQFSSAPSYKEMDSDTSQCFETSFYHSEKI